jgi:hypothetical protein
MKVRIEGECFPVDDIIKAKEQFIKKLEGYEKCNEDGTYCNPYDIVEWNDEHYRDEFDEGQEMMVGNILDRVSKIIEDFFGR